MMIPDKLYLKNRRNLAYLQGDEERPRSPKPMSCVGWFFFVGLILLLLAVGLGIFQEGYYSLENKSNLRSRGIEYEGRMEDRSYSTSDDSTTYYITYSHDFREGYYVRTLRVSEDMYENQFERGRRVTLIVDPLNPALFDVPPSAFWVEYSGPFMTFGCSISFLLLSFMEVGLWIKRNARIRRLWQEGYVIYGKVSSMEEATDEGGKFWMVYYCFTSPLSQTVIRASQTVKHKKFRTSDDLNGFSVGILFLEDDNWDLL